MRRAIIGLACTLFTVTMFTYAMAFRGYEEPPPPEPVIETDQYDTDIIDTDTIPDEEITQEEMARDIIDTWNIFFKDEHVRQSDPRRTRFKEFAEIIARWVTWYQNNPTDIGGQLPKHRSSHLLAAVVVTQESSVDHTVFGSAPRYEAGLFQVWGVAAAGYDKDEIRRSPELGIMLGVRWLAYCTSQCKQTRISVDSTEWRTSDWLRPMTAYGSKPKSFRRKNGTCKIFPFARRRVDMVRIYMDRIDAGRQKEGLTRQA